MWMIASPVFRNFVFIALVVIVALCGGSWIPAIRRRSALGSNGKRRRRRLITSRLYEIRFHSLIEWGRSKWKIWLSFEGHVLHMSNGVRDKIKKLAASSPEKVIRRAKYNNISILNF
jgi:hypothetical protein